MLCGVRPLPRKIRYLRNAGPSTYCELGLERSSAGAAANDFRPARAHGNDVIIKRSSLMS